MNADHINEGEQFNSQDSKVEQTYCRDPVVWKLCKIIDNCQICEAKNMHDPI